MNIDSTSELVLKVENSCSKLNLVWQGFNTWPALRIVLWSILLRYDQPPILTSRSSLRRLLGKFKKYTESARIRLCQQTVEPLRDLYGTKHMGPADALYLTRDSAKQMLPNGRWCDVLFPSLQDGVCRAGGCSLLMLEVLINPQQINSPRHSSSALMHMPSVYKQAFEYHRDRAEQFLRDALEDSFLQRELIRIRRLDYYIFFLQRSSSMLGAIAAYSPFYESVLQDVRPKIVFLRCYYSAYSLPLLLACKRMGIPTADVQHGIQYPEHLAYGCWNNISHAGYELLPDFFLTWSDHEVDVIEEWSKQSGGAHKAISIGHPWLEAWDANLIPGVAEYKRQAKECVDRNLFSRVILFTQQPLPGNLELCVSAVKSSPMDWLWLIRCHPTLSTEAKHRIENHFSGYPNVNIKDATRLPMPALLEIADLHVTQCSSSSIEAASLGIPSIALHEDGVRLFSHISPELLRLSADGDGFVNMAHEAMAKRKRASKTTESIVPNHKLVGFLEEVFGAKRPAQAK